MNAAAAKTSPNADLEEFSTSDEKQTSSREQKRDMLRIIIACFRKRPSSKKLGQKTTSKTFGDCHICLDDMPVDELVSTKVGKNCRHRPSVCVNCFNTSVEFQLASNPWSSISCPVCPNILSSKAVFGVIGSDHFLSGEYRDFLNALKHHNREHFQWCLNPRCHSGQIHNLGKYSPMICTTCRFQTCVYHSTPWHEGRQCAQVDANPYELEGLHFVDFMEEMANYRIIEETTKKCPSCGIDIEKNGGCNHITCIKCWHEFSWKTLKPYVY